MAAAANGESLEKKLIQDHSLRCDSLISYTIGNTGAHSKLVGTAKCGFRSFAYFTTSIEEARQAIRIDYLMKSRGMVEVA